MLLFIVFYVLTLCFLSLLLFVDLVVVYTPAYMSCVLIFWGFWEVYVDLSKVCVYVYM